MGIERERLDRKLKKSNLIAFKTTITCAIKVFWGWIWEKEEKKDGKKFSESH